MCDKIPAMDVSPLKLFPLTDGGLTCKSYVLINKVSFQGYFRQGIFVLSPIFHTKMVLMSCASPDELAELSQLQGDLTPANTSAKAWLPSCQDHI